MGCRRENTGRGFTRLRAAPPVSEGWHKREDPVVRHVLHRANRCLKGLLGSSIKDLGRVDIPIECFASGGGLSPMGNLKADDATGERR